MSDITTSHEVQMKFRNFYRCPDDGAEWQDEWDSACNDHCPKCDAEISPYKSEDISHSVKAAYENGACPDCGEEIPDDAPEGWGCPNCGHACFAEPTVSYKVNGLVTKNILPFMGVQFEKQVTFKFKKDGKAVTRKFLVITYQAYNAFGLIGSESNGVAVLDEDNHSVVCDEIAKESTGYFGVSNTQVAFAERLSTDATWKEFRNVVNNHPRKRYDI